MVDTETLQSDAESLYEQGDYAGALDRFRSLLDVTLDSPQVLNDLGATCAALGRTDEAEGYYRRALALRPDYHEARENLQLCRARRPSSPDGAAARDISVVVPVHDRFAVLAECLSALAAQTMAPERFEVLVVANGVGGPSLTELRAVTDSFRAAFGPRLTLLTLAQAAIPAARNEGVRNARGRLILQVNEDTILSPNALDQHYADHEAAGFDPRIVIVGGRRFDRESRRRLFNYLYEELQLYCALHKTEPRFECDYHWFVTCNLSCQAEAYARFGLFDESLEWGSDSDLGRRWVQEHEVRIIANPAIVSLHRHELSFATWRRDCARRAALRYRMETGREAAELCADDPYLSRKRNEFDGLDRAAFEREIERVERAFDGPDGFRGNSFMGRSVGSASELAAAIKGPLAKYKSYVEYAELTRLAGATHETEDVAELMAEAERAYREGDLKKAHGLYERAVAREPDNAEAHNDLGTVKVRAGELRDGLDCFIRALGADPSYELAQRNLTMVCRALGIAPERVLPRAGSASKATESAHPRQAAPAGVMTDFTARRIEDLCARGDYEAAHRLAACRTEAEPDNAEAWNDLAVIVRNLDRSEQAADAIRRAARLAPDDETIQHNAQEILGAVPATPLPTVALPEPRLRGRRARDINLLALEIKGLGSFMRELAAQLDHVDGVNARHLELVTGDEQLPVDAADVVWLEWANDLAILMTNKLSCLKEKKVVCRMHRFEVFMEWPERINWSVVDRLVLVSETMRRTFHQRFPAARVRTQVIHNGLDMDRYAIAPRKESAMDIALIAHLNHRKNLPLLLQIAAILKARGCPGKIHVAGEWQTPELQQYFEYMLDEMDLRDRIVLDGWVGDMPAWLADKRHVLATSTHESFGYSVFEGMAAGLRPVVHNFPGAHEFLRPEHIFNTAEEAADMLMADAGDPRLYRAYVEERFPRRRQVQETLDLLDDLMDAARPGATAAAGVPVGAGAGAAGTPDRFS